jgi:hypothetical protein
MSNVLVMFQADTEATEQLALAVAVGAVEGGGSIRLRRLAAVGAAEVGHKGYGRLGEADLLWADALVVGLESKTNRPDEVGELLGWLKKLKLDGKVGWTFGPAGYEADGAEARAVVDSALTAAGVSLLGTDRLRVGEAEDLIGWMKIAGRASSGGM